ncbi:MAG TPA: hypothetical protein VNO70_16475 [Blastocatellia bacterium]|nr:hypothetical protein [Blastocatellia bacterium]
MSVATETIRKAKRGSPSKAATRRTTAAPKRRKPEAPELPEKTKKLILKGFRLAYEAHHGKRS